MNRTKKSMWSVRVLITLSILMALSGIAGMTSAQPEDEPLPPNRFAGNVIFNGEDAPVGAVINAYIDGELRGSKVVETAGEYVQLGVTGYASDNDPEITFTVCGGVANETAVWYAGEPPRMLDLSAEAEEEPPVVTDPSANPESIPADGVSESRLNVTVTDDSEIDFVVVNLSAIGGPDAQVMECIGENMYSAVVTAAVGTAAETYCLPVNASDTFGNWNDSVCIELNITTGRACGDVDTHEGLDARDVTYLAKHVAEISGYETLYGDGDVDTHEGLDARDVTYLAKHVAEISGYETLHCRGS